MDEASILVRRESPTEVETEINPCAADDAAVVEDISMWTKNVKEMEI